MVVDVMVRFEPCEYTRKMIFRSVTQSCQPLNEKLSFLRWYLFTLIFTSSVLFSRLKKANRLQRIYLVIYLSSSSLSSSSESVSFAFYSALFALSSVIFLI